ncbi:AAA family ATPase [candidate division KSB1 bacterium]|nr:AAA family ATPase [candidate division KSB1 bacterium]
MRITHICVKDLFGLFRHDIPLFTEERITIIHGPNGYGKTSVLHLLQSVFSDNSFHLIKIPFSELVISFDEGPEFKILKKMHQQNRVTKEIRFLYGDQSFILKPHVKTDLSSPFPAYADTSGNLEEIYKLKELEETGTFKDFLDKIVEIYGIINPAPMVQQPDWLYRLRHSVAIRMIDSQRLLQQKSSNRLAARTEGTFLPSVAKYSDEIIDLLRSTLADYAALSQSLDRTFPRRFVQQLESTDPLDEKALREKFENLEKKRLRFIRVGILEAEQSPAFSLPEKLDRTTRNMLSIYLQDTAQKLSILDPLADKIELFQNTINQLFDYKKIEISKNKGFSFILESESELQPVELSSGEQHEIVLLYELLFKAKPDTLILIDEPELSLHVLWQEAFLEGLSRITRLADLDVIIATHSPQVIHDRWDLTVELQGPVR